MVRVKLGLGLMDILWLLYHASCLYFLQHMGLRNVGYLVGKLYMAFSKLWQFRWDAIWVLYHVMEMSAQFLQANNIKISFETFFKTVPHF